jgi:hypothetical protein
VDAENTAAVPPPRPSPRRGDITLLLGAAVGVLLGGVVIAAAILAITAGGGAPSTKHPIPFGSETDIRQKVRDGGPINIAGLSGDDGFWVAIESHRLVALLVKQPKPDPCTLIWRGSKDTFTCDGKPVDSTTMARYRTFTGRSGANKGQLMVRLRDVVPGPAGPPGSGG